MSATLERTRISLELACGLPSCAEFGLPLYRQLVHGYEECALLVLPQSLDEWRAEHRTARKRADRARRRGYRFSAIARHDRAAEIYAINTSAAERQGRPMTKGYRQPPSQTPLPDYPCPLHAVRTYGVETLHGRLVAYLFVVRSGALALVSQILGHAAYLEDEIMYLLVEGAIGRETRWPGLLVYNRWDSGSDGLRFFKARLGFEPGAVEWAA